MIQNHLLPVMATTAMEPSASFHADAVRDERSKCCAHQAHDPGRIRQGHRAAQYGPARVGAQEIPGFPAGAGRGWKFADGYLCRCHLLCRQWRWAGVPFYVRTGKRLPKRVPRSPSNQPGAARHFGDGDGDGSAPISSFCASNPKEGISLKFLSKRPGEE